MEYLRVDAAVVATPESWKQPKSNEDAMSELKNHEQEQPEDRAMTEGTRCTGMNTTAFFAGLVAGIGTGLLLAPQSGVRTGRQLHSLAKDPQKETSHMLGNAKTSIGKLIEQDKSRYGVSDREIAT